MKKNIVMIIVAIVAMVMCTEASAQRETKIMTSITGRHTFLMSLEANAMADKDPLDGSFKADFGGLAKITYFYYGNAYSFKVGYRRENIQVALSYARNLTGPGTKFRPNIEIEAGVMNQNRSLYYQAEEMTADNKPAASHEYWNYKLRPYVGLNINFEIAVAQSSAVEIGAFGYYLPYEGKEAPGDIKTTVGGSDVSGQMVKMDLDTSKFKFGVKVAYKFDIAKLFH